MGKRTIYEFFARSFEGAMDKNSKVDAQDREKKYHVTGSFRFSDGREFKINKMMTEKEMLEGRLEKAMSFVRWLAEDSLKYRGSDAGILAKRTLKEIE